MGEREGEGGGGEGEADSYLHVNLHGGCFVVFDLVAAVARGISVQPGAVCNGVTKVRS